MKKRIFTAFIATMLLFAICVGASADFESNADIQSQESVQPRYREYLEVTRSCSLYSKNPCDYGTGAYNKIICYLEPGDTLDMRQYYVDTNGQRWWYCEVLSCTDSKFNYNNTFGYVNASYVQGVVE